MCGREQRGMCWDACSSQAAIRRRETPLDPRGSDPSSLLHDLIRLKTNCCPTTTFVSPAAVTSALNSPRPLL